MQSHIYCAKHMAALGSFQVQDRPIQAAATALVFTRIRLPYARLCRGGRAYKYPSASSRGLEGFCACCRRQSFDPPPPDPQTVGLYITAQASGSRPGVARDQTDGGRGWIEFFPDMGVLVTGRGETVGASTIRRSHGWSSARPWPPVCPATCGKANEQSYLPAIRCAQASPPRLRSTNAMCRSNSAMPAPR